MCKRTCCFIERLPVLVHSFMFELIAIMTTYLLTAGWTLLVIETIDKDGEVQSEINRQITDT